jgi:tetratricopeptide (TPR) repeat protein
MMSIPELSTGSNLYEASEALLKQATDIDPAFASAWLLRAHLSSPRSGDASEFLPHVEHALANIEPMTPLERAFITAYPAQMYASAGIDPTGNLQRAARFYESALQIAPQHYHTMIQLPVVYRELGRITDADRVTLDALRAHPDSLRFGVDAVKGYVRTGRIDLAAPIAESLLGRDTSAWEADSRALSNGIAWLRLWRVHAGWIAGDAPGALRHLRAADARWAHMRSRLWLHHLINAYGGPGRFDEAADVAARMAPEYRQWWEAMISVWREDHETFRRLTAPHLGHFEVLHNRSGMLAFMGWTKAAAWVAAERERRHIRMPWGEKTLSQGPVRNRAGPLRGRGRAAACRDRWPPVGL